MIRARLRSVRSNDRRARSAADNARNSHWFMRRAGFFGRIFVLEIQGLGVVPLCLAPRKNSEGLETTGFMQPAM